MTSPREFSIQNLRDRWDDLPDIKIRFGEHETGWAKSLGDGLASINNHPMEERLNFMDIVKLEPSDDGWNQAGEVIWRAYDCKTVIKYPAATDKSAKVLYKQIATAVLDAGLSMEGLAYGWCAISHQKDANVETILTDAGIRIDELEFFDGNESDGDGDSDDEED